MSRRLAPFTNRLFRFAIVGLAAFAGLTCRDRSLTGPGLPSRAHLAMAPRFSVVEGAPSVLLGSVRAEVFRLSDESLVLDTTASFAPGDTVLQLDLTVTMLGPNEAFGVRLTAFDTSVPAQVVYSGYDTLTAHPAEIPGEPAEIVLEYAGGDTIVAAVAVAPRDTLLTVGDEFTFRSRATKADESLVIAQVGWTSRDTNKLAVDLNTGLAKAKVEFTDVWLVGTTYSGKKDSTKVSASQSVGSVTIAPPNATVIAGRTQQLTATVVDTRGFPLPTRPVTWSSSNELVATVNTSGLVTAVAPGAVTITATSDGVNGTAAITVIPVPVARITVASDMTLAVGSTATLVATLFDADNNVLTLRPTTWVSASPAVVSVDPISGLITALATGTAQISANSEGKTGFATVTVIRNTTQLTTIAATGVYGGTVLLSATLTTTGGAPLAGRTITFFLANTMFGGLPATAVTDASGVATIPAASLGTIPAGVYSVPAIPGGIFARFDGDAANNPSSADAVLIVNKAQATLALSALTHVYDGAPKAAVATTTPGGLTGVTISYSQGGVPVAAPTAAGSYDVRATLTNANYQAADVTGTLVINQAAQLITFAALAPRTFGEGPFLLSATASSGLTVTFAVTGNCTVTGATLTITGAGSCAVTASQAGDANRAAALSVAQSFAINKASASLSFGPLNATYDGAPKPVSAITTPAGLTGVAVTYDGSATAPTNAGSYTVSATLTNANYQATPATGNYVIAKGTPTIVWNTPTNIQYGTPLDATQLNATATLNGVPVSGAFTYTPPAGTVLSVGAGQTLSVDFAPTDAANLNGASASVTFDVRLAEQTILFAPLADRLAGEPDFQVSATATSGLPVTYTAGGVCTIAGDIVHTTGPGLCVITASQAGDANYMAAPDVVQTFTVTGPGPVTLTADSTGGLYGGTVRLTATLIGARGPLAGRVVDFFLNDALAGSAITDAAGVATIPAASLAGINAAGYRLGYSFPYANPGVYATFSGDESYQSATANAHLEVSRAPATLTFGNLSFTYDGTEHVPTVTTSPAGIDGIVIHYGEELSGAPPVNAGSYPVRASLYHPNYELVFTTGTLVIAKATPVIAWAPPAEIEFGTELSATQLNATALLSDAPVAGTFTYTPPAGTVLSVGAAQLLSVSFDPTDAGNFNAISGENTIDVVQATQTITFGAIPDRLAGEPDFVVSATAASGLPVTFAASGSCTITGDVVHTTGPGQCTITASQAGDASYAAAPDVEQTFNVTGSSPVTLVVDAVAGTYGGQVTLTATLTGGSGPLAGKLITFRLNGIGSGSVETDASGVATLENAILTGITAGFYPDGVRAEFDGDASYESAAETADLTIAKATATLVFDNLSFVYDGLSHAPTVITTPAGIDGVILSYYDGGSPPMRAGSHEVHASLDNPNFVAANIDSTIVIDKAEQTITFDPLPEAVFDNDPPFEVSATSSSGLTVSFVASGSCSVLGTTLTITGTGGCSITAQQSGGSDYNAAPDVEQTTNIILRPVTTVTVSPQTSMIRKGETVVLSYTLADAGGNPITGRPVTWTTWDGLILVPQGPDGNTNPILGANIGSASISVTENASGAIGYATINVETSVASLQFSPTSVTFPSLADQQQLTATPLDRDGGLVAGTVTWLSRNETVASVDGGGIVKAEYNGSTYIIAEVEGYQDSVLVAVAQQVASIGVVPSSETNVAGSAVYLSPTAQDGNGYSVANPLPYLFSSDNTQVATVDANGVVQSDAAGSVTITVTSGSFTATSFLTFTPAKLSQAIDYPALDPATAYYGEAMPYLLGATASSGLPVSYDFAGVCSIVNDGVEISGPGSCFITASQSGSDVYSAAQPVMQELVVLPARLAQTIDFTPVPTRTWGDANPVLSATASSGAEVMFSTLSGACYIDGGFVIYQVGECAVKASVEGTAEYLPAEVTRIITTVPLPLTIIVVNDTYTYDGTEKNPELATEPASWQGWLTIQYESGTTPIEPGDYPFVVFNDYPNFAAEPVSGVLHILPPSRAEDPITFDPLPTWTYGDGNQVTLSATSSSGLPVYFSAVGSSCGLDGPLYVFDIGPCTVTAYTEGDASWLPSTVSQDLVTQKAQLTINIVNDVVQFNDQTQSPTFSTNPGGFENLVIVTYENEANPVIVGSYPFTATIDDPHYFADPVNGTLTIQGMIREKSSQSIDWSPIQPNPVYFDQQFPELTATSNSELPITYSLSGACAMSEGPYFTGPGTCVITASQAGDDNYNPAPDVIQELEVLPARAPQSITFETIPTLSWNSGTYPMVASASSGLPVSFSIISGDCGYVGVTLTFIAVGQCTVQVNQEGNSDYAAAQTVEQVVTIGPATARISIDNDVAYYDGTVKSPVVSVDAPVSVTISWELGEAPREIGRYSFIASINDPNYVADPVVGTLTIELNPDDGRSVQTITFDEFAPITVDDPAPSLDARTSSGLSVWYSVAGDCTYLEVLTILGAGACDVTAHQDGDVDWYAATPLTRRLIINKAPQNLTVLPPSDRSYEDAPFQLDISSALGRWVFSDVQGQCTVDDGGVVTMTGTIGSCFIAIFAPGDDRYADESATAYFDIAYPSPTTVSVSPTTASVSIGGSQQLTATAFDQRGNPIPVLAFTWASLNTAIATVAGTPSEVATVTPVSEGVVTIRATSGEASGDASVTVTPPPMPTKTWIGGNGNGPTQWQLGANWSGGIAPGINDSAVVSPSAFDPQLINDATVGSLTLLGGAQLDVGQYAISIDRNLDAGTTIIGTSGRVKMIGANTTVRGKLNNLQVVSGIAKVSGPMTVTGWVSIETGTVLDMNGFKGTVADTLGGKGRLLMNKAGDTLAVTGNSRFSSVQSGDLTAGALILAGNLTTTTSFSASGSHELVLNRPSVAQQVNLGSTHRLQNVRILNPSGASFSNTHISGNLVIDSAVTQPVSFSATSQIDGAITPLVSPLSVLSGTLIVSQGLNVKSGGIVTGPGTLDVVGPFSSEAGSVVNMTGTIQLDHASGTTNVDVASFTPNTLGTGGSNVPLNGGLKYTNLNIKAGTVTFLGRDTIPGTVTGANGSMLRLNGQHVVVNGNLDVYSIAMNLASDSLDVGGTANFGGISAGNLTAGVLRVASNFNTTIAKFFSASGTHKVVLNGPGHQFVSVNGANTSFQDLALSAKGVTIRGVVVLGAMTVDPVVDSVVIAAGNSATTTFNGSVTPARSMWRIGNTATASFALSWTVESTGSVLGAVSLPTGVLEVKGALTTQPGSTVSPATVRLNDVAGTSLVSGTFAPATLEMQGAMLGKQLKGGLQYGNLKLTGGSSIFLGDATLTGAITSAFSGAILNIGGHHVVANSINVDRVLMQTVGDTLDVLTNATFRGGSNVGDYNAGVLRVAGTFDAFVCCGAYFFANGTHKVILNGTTARQAMKMGGAQQLQNLEITNPLGADLYVVQVTDSFVVAPSVTAGLTFFTDAGSAPSVFKKTSAMTIPWTLNAANVDVQILDTLTLGAGGGVSGTGTLRAGAIVSDPTAAIGVPAVYLTGEGGTFGVQGSYTPTLTVFSGTIANKQMKAGINYTNVQVDKGGAMIVGTIPTTITGNLTVTTNAGGYLNLNGHSLLVTGNVSSTGLKMKNSKDTLTVAGSAAFVTASSGNTNELIDGLIIAHGNFTASACCSTPQFAASGNHRVLLDGTGRQDVTFGAAQYFQDLDISNTNADTSLGVHFIGTMTRIERTLHMLANARAKVETGKILDVCSLTTTSSIVLDDFSILTLEDDPTPAILESFTITGPNGTIAGGARTTCPGPP